MIWVRIYDLSQNIWFESEYIYDSSDYYMISTAFFGYAFPRKKFVKKIFCLKKKYFAPLVFQKKNIFYPSFKKKFVKKIFCPPLCFFQTIRVRKIFQKIFSSKKLRFPLFFKCIFWQVFLYHIILVLKRSQWLQRLF